MGGRGGGGPEASPGREPRLRERARGALVGVAVGDALGAPFEGHAGLVALTRITAEERRPHQLRHTDDTALTLAVAASLLAADDVDEDELAERLARQWEADPGRGYGGGAATLFARIRAGERWQAVAPSLFGGQGSLGNGAAMRVAPVALFAAGDASRAAELARRTARVTHHHPVAIDAAALQAAAVAVAMGEPSGGPLDRDRFLGRLAAVVETSELAAKLDVVGSLLDGAEPERVAAALGTGVRADEAVPAAICTFLQLTPSFPDVVRGAVHLGGDTDTVAAMAGALAGAHLGEGAIPPEWRDRVEALEQLRVLADGLAERAGTRARGQTGDGGARRGGNGAGRGS